jgi:hypothetical protein
MKTFVLSMLVGVLMGGFLCLCLLGFAAWRLS